MNTTELQESMVVFLDTIGRLIIGESIKDRCNDNDLVVKNPVVIHIEPRNGQISIQFFPLVFKEFLGSKDEGIVFSYNKKNISLADKTVLDFKIYAQYIQLFSNAPQTQPQNQNNQSQPQVIKLFE
jgi:hypothetical protein